MVSMSEFDRKRLCSEVTKKGEACRAWAVRGTEPPLCSAHAGRNVGAGAPAGNVNALKHGIYQKFDSPEEVEELDRATLKEELRLLRIGLRRMAWLLERDDLSVMEYTAVMGKITSGARAVGFLEPMVMELQNEGEWDAVLDELGEQWGIEI